MGDEDPLQLHRQLTTSLGGEATDNFSEVFKVAQALHQIFVDKDHEVSEEPEDSDGGLEVSSHSLSTIFSYNLF